MVQVTFNAGQPFAYGRGGSISFRTSKLRLIFQLLLPIRKREASPHSRLLLLYFLCPFPRLQPTVAVWV